MSRCIIVLSLVVLSNAIEAQVLLKGDSLFFGPCMRLNPAAHVKIEYDYCSYDIRFLNRGSVLLRVWLDYDDLFEKKSAEKCLSRPETEWSSGPVIKLPNVEVEKWRSFEANGLVYQVNKQTEYNRARGLGQKEYKEKYFAITIDTVLYESVHLFVNHFVYRRRELKKELRMLRNLHVLSLENCPSNNLVIADDSLSIQLMESSVDKAGLRANLPCMSLEEFKKDNENYYTSDIDKMFEAFDYAGIADTLYNRICTRNKNKWQCEKDALEQMFEGLDITIQNEISLHQRLYRNEVDLSAYVNYFKMKNIPTYFDTLNLIRFRHHELLPVVQPFSVFIEKCEDNERFKPFQKMHSNIGKEDQKEYLLASFIARKYLKSKPENFKYSQLYNDHNRLIYLFESVNSDSFERYIANLSEEPEGKWSIKVEPLVNIHYDIKPDSIFYFGGLTSFVLVNDFLVLNPDGSDEGSDFIKSFPDSLPGFNYIAVVKGPKDLFDNWFKEQKKNGYPMYDFRRKHPLAYPVADIDKEHFVRQSEYDATESIYLHSGSGDLNGDGLIEIYSFGISNGKVVFAKGYNVQNVNLVQIGSEEIIRKLQYFGLFRNIILYSQFAHGGN